MPKFYNTAGPTIKTDNYYIVFDHGSIKSWDEKICHNEEDGLLVMGC